MKTGIIGDIHSNLQALETVLAALDEERVDEVVCVGDVVGYGADPGACIERVRQRCRAVVVGNHDQAAVKKIPPDYFNAEARSAIAWTTERLTDDERWWLSNLPLVHLEDAFSLVHGSFERPEEFRYIFDPEDAGPSFEKQPAQVAFFGHTHWPVTFIDENPVSLSLQSEVPVVLPAKMLVNVGSVGQPRDSNPAASYAVFDQDLRRVRLLRASYDVETAAARIREAGLPPSLADRLSNGH